MPIPSATMSGENLALLSLEIQVIMESGTWNIRGRTECACGKVSAYRCVTCTSVNVNLCQDCIVDAHAGLPFHEVLEWNDGGGFFMRTDLRELGLRITLGHGGATCPNARSAKLEAITPVGLRTVAVEFCACANAWSDSDQIKAHGWWPLGANFCSALDKHELDRVLSSIDSLTADSDRNSSDSDQESSDGEGSAISDSANM
ncbi:hypothetical protein C8R43DRAFT_1137001 [Mycena crocata]|nr:hypothetical protein C8R43DRAFT_1137001 [Mycena crocata]